MSARPTVAYDHLGLKKVCCTEGTDALWKGAEKAAQRSKDLVSKGFFEVGPGAEVTASTMCMTDEGGKGTAIVDFFPLYYKKGPCEKECVKVHEGLHAWVCKDFGPVVLGAAGIGDLDEALAYMAEAVCLAKAANDGFIDADKEFSKYGPLPTP